MDAPNLNDVAAIIAAAGKSTRFGNSSTKKVFVEVGGRPIWSYSAQKFREAGIREVKLVVAPEDRAHVTTAYGQLLNELSVQIVEGGQQRADSVLNGLSSLSGEVRFVAVHDGARPCLSLDSIHRVFDAARQSQAAILAVKCAATIKRTDSEGWIEETIPREHIWLAQTPQVFSVELLREAFTSHPSPSQATDEAAIVEALGHRVQVVEDAPTNIKVTTQADMQFVRSFFQ